ncbi:MAG: metallophosphoesterase family protein, partial [Rhizobacter sp.]|nr:metallophosphoesterase family protein [Rhizobacter sp.]
MGLLLLFASGVAWSQTTLIAPGSAWKYLDNGSNQGTAWRAAAFDDSAWASGAAQLGYGDGDETTLLGYGANASAKYITTYFRRSFSVADPAAFSALSLRVKRDDGIVIYLNGAEVYRNNMPAGSVTYTTLASSYASDDGATWQTAALPTAGLAPGTNVLAVEMHQSLPDSSDISFDLELTGSGTTSGGAVVTRGPYLQLGTPNSMTVRWRTNNPTDSRVLYGLATSSLSASASDATQTTEHSVTLTGLNPDTKYFYSVGTSTAALAGADANHYFITSPAPGSQRATRIWVIGDAGEGNADQARVRDAYYNRTGTTHTDLWLQLGDNAYDNGTDAEYQTKMFDVYRDMLRKSVTWPTIGNHDTAESTSPPASLPFFQMFSFPTTGQAGGVASGSKNYYSFDFGNVHFVNLDSMASSRAAGSAMLNWLQQDLAANTKEWTIAFWHHPPYSKGVHDS